MCGVSSGQLPSLVPGNNLSPVASKVLSHRVPMGGGYMQSYTYHKQASVKQQHQPAIAVAVNAKLANKAMYNPQRASAYRYKSTLAPSVSSASLSNTLNNSKKYVSPYSQRAMNSFMKE